MTNYIFWLGQGGFEIRKFPLAIRSKHHTLYINDEELHTKPIETT
jgi:hypothetical protein